MWVTIISCLHTVIKCRIWQRQLQVTESSRGLFLHFIVHGEFDYFSIVYEKDILLGLEGGYIEIKMKAMPMWKLTTNATKHGIKLEFSMQRLQIIVQINIVLCRHRLLQLCSFSIPSHRTKKGKRSTSCFYWSWYFDSLCRLQKKHFLFFITIFCFLNQFKHLGLAGRGVWMQNSSAISWVRKSHWPQ